MSAAEELSLISLVGVSRVYPRTDGDVVALDSVSLEVERAELVSIAGPSGSGKSTLLHILGLLDTPTRGLYRLATEEVSHLDDQQRTTRRNRKIGFIFQAFHLVPHLTLAENVALPLIYRRLAPRMRVVLAQAALERVGLLHRAAHLPDELSGGEQQRAAIARALVAEPEVVLADEPTGNLDQASADRILSIFREIRDVGTTVIIVTHSPKIAMIADRCYQIEHGTLLA